MIVRCDNPRCTFKIETTSIKSYYKKPCPKCGTGPLINDQDMGVHYLVRFWKMLDGIASSIARLLRVKPKRMRVRMDTGPMRKGDPLKITIEQLKMEKPIYD